MPNKRQRRKLEKQTLNFIIKNKDKNLGYVLPTAGEYKRMTRAQKNFYNEKIQQLQHKQEWKRNEALGGILLGSPIQDGDRIVIIEDVTTAGTSIEETLPIIRRQGQVNPIGLVVSVDRMERGQGEKSALQEIQEKYGLKTTAIVTMAEVVEHLYNRPYKGKIIIDDTLKEAIDAYYLKYGVN